MISFVCCMWAWAWDLTVQAPPVLCRDHGLTLEPPFYSKFLTL